MQEGEFMLGMLNNRTANRAWDSCIALLENIFEKFRALFSDYFGMNIKKLCDIIKELSDISTEELSFRSIKHTDSVNLEYCIPFRSSETCDVKDSNEECSSEYYVKKEESPCFEETCNCPIIQKASYVHSLKTNRKESLHEVFCCTDQLLEIDKLNLSTEELLNCFALKNKKKTPTLKISTSDTRRGDMKRSSLLSKHNPLNVEKLKSDSKNNSIKLSKDKLHMTNDFEKNFIKNLNGISSPNVRSRNSKENKGTQTENDFITYLMNGSKQKLESGLFKQISKLQMLTDIPKSDLANSEILQIVNHIEVLIKKAKRILTDDIDDSKFYVNESCNNNNAFIRVHSNPRDYKSMHSRDLDIPFNEKLIAATNRKSVSLTKLRRDSENNVLRFAQDKTHLINDFEKRTRNLNRVLLSNTKSTTSNESKGIQTENDFIRNFINVPEQNLGSDVFKQISRLLILSELMKSDLTKSELLQIVSHLEILIKNVRRIFTVDIDDNLSDSKPGVNEGCKSNNNLIQAHRNLESNESKSAWDSCISLHEKSATEFSHKDLPLTTEVIHNYVPLTPTCKCGSQTNIASQIINASHINFTQTLQEHKCRDEAMKDSISNAYYLSKIIENIKQKYMEETSFKYQPVQLSRKYSECEPAQTTCKNTGKTTCLLKIEDLETEDHMKDNLYACNKINSKTSDEDKYPSGHINKIINKRKKVKFTDEIEIFFYDPNKSVSDAYYICPVSAIQTEGQKLKTKRHGSSTEKKNTTSTLVRKVNKAFGKENKEESSIKEEDNEISEFVRRIQKFETVDRNFVEIPLHEASSKEDLDFIETKERNKFIKKKLKREDKIHLLNPIPDATTTVLPAKLINLKSSFEYVMKGCSKIKSNVIKIPTKKRHYKPI